jgi:hypothetical protein
MTCVLVVSLYWPFVVTVIVVVGLAVVVRYLGWLVGCLFFIVLVVVKVVVVVFVVVVVVMVVISSLCTRVGFVIGRYAGQPARR